MKAFQLDEHVIEDKRLGRHVQHDPRSRAFAVEEVIDFESLKSVVHRHYGPVFDQGNLGSCTGNAISQTINTVPTHILHHRLLVEKDAVNIYSKATQIDEFPDAFPPIDTGSSGIAVCKIAQSLGLITKYLHAFSIEQAVSALQDRPVITGIPWLESMDEPDEDGMVKVSGQVRGGHEIMVLGFHIPSHANNILDCVAEFLNSWSKTWGHRGRFFMMVRDWAELLDQEGDVTIPVRV